MSSCVYALLMGLCKCGGTTVQVCHCLSVCIYLCCRYIYLLYKYIVNNKKIEYISPMCINYSIIKDQFLSYPKIMSYLGTDALIKYVLLQRRNSN